MKKPDSNINSWIPIGIGDFWSAQCLTTREFVAVGSAPHKPLLFPTAASVLVACDNAERGVYDNAPPGTVWRVISNGTTTRRERLDAARETHARLAAARAAVKKGEALSLGEFLRQRLEGNRVPMDSSGLYCGY